MSLSAVYSYNKHVDQTDVSHQFYSICLQKESMSPISLHTISIKQVILPNIIINKLRIVYLVLKGSHPKLSDHYGNKRSMKVLFRAVFFYEKLSVSRF